MVMMVDGGDGNDTMVLVLVTMVVIILLIIMWIIMMVVVVLDLTGASCSKTGRQGQELPSGVLSWHWGTHGRRTAAEQGF